MSTSPSPVSMIAGAVGAAAGTAVSVATGPWALASQAIGTLGSKLLDLIPTQEQKIQAQQHISDQQYNLALAQIDQMNKEMAAASANVSADSKVSGARAFLGYGITAMILFNYSIVPFIHALLKLDVAPVVIPSNVLIIYAVVMLGFVGIPQSIDMVKAIAMLPGDSQIKLPLGMGSVGNKS